MVCKVNYTDRECAEMLYTAGEAGTNSTGGQNLRMVNVSSQAGHYYEQTGCNGTSLTNHLTLLYQ